MDGWIKLHRKITENPYYFSEPFTRSQAWIDMLIIANHKDSMFYKRGIKVDVKRGQIGYDIETLGKRWKWSRGKAERFFLQLEKDRQIVRQKNNITTLISICNYDMYQTDDKAKRNANDKANDKADGQQIAKQTDTNNNVYKDNNENIVKEVRVINYPFESENFMHYWSMWKEYKKKELRFNFKTTISEQMALNSLKKKSGNNEDIAIEIIEHSISCGYKGLFSPNDKKPNINSPPQQPKKQDNLTTLKTNYEGALKILFPNGEPTEPTFDITVSGEGNAPRLLIKGSNEAGS